jgi:fructokinase
MTISDFLKKRKPGGRVYCIGEALLDIIFSGWQPRHAIPGGSMLNTAISLGRCGIPVSLISDLASDLPGEMITRFLNNNGVATDYIRRYDQGKTAIALAYTDENNNVTYSFYKDYPVNRFPSVLPVIRQGDIVLFGSMYSLLQDSREERYQFLQEARNEGALLIYDPNFRKPHLHDLENLRRSIMENIALSHIVKGSDEDFQHIFNAQSFDQAIEAVRQCGCQNLIYTRNIHGTDAWLNNRFYHTDARKIVPVSTIGAGDAFSAGLIYALINTETHQAGYETSLLEYGTRFSAEVCSSSENYISPSFGTQILNETQ